MLPRLPMTPFHQQLVAKGRKCSTLRFPALPIGMYTMVGKGGAFSLGDCFITKVDPSPIRWTALDDAEKLNIAYQEGYNSITTFERAANFIPGGAAFLSGHREMYLHHIRYDKG